MNNVIKQEVWDIERVIETMTENNPRVISQKQLEDLSRNIREFGLLLPVVYNQRTKNLVGGHQRVRASKLEGLTEINVNIIDIDLEDEKVLSIALNKIEGKWDYQLLEEALNTLAGSEALALAGFSELDINDLTSSFETPEDNQDEEYEQFIQKFQQKQSSEYVRFTSKTVKFTCYREDYNTFIGNLYTQVGEGDDAAASTRFFELIGL